MTSMQIFNTKVHIFLNSVTNVRFIQYVISTARIQAYTHTYVHTSFLLVILPLDAWIASYGTCIYIYIYIGTYTHT